MHRDVIKESLTRTMGVPPDRDNAKQLGATSFDAFFSIIDSFVACGVGVIAEAAYHQGPADAALGRLLPRARVVVLHCAVDEQLAARRYADRAERGERHACHTDPAVIEEMRQDDWGFARYAPTTLDVAQLTVDTTDGYAPTFETIVAFVNDSE